MDTVRRCKLVSNKLIIMANKTVISVSKPTPAWANWAFRVILLLGTTVNTAVANAPRIGDQTKLDIVYWSGVVVTAVWALSRILGVKVDEPTWVKK